MLAGRTREGIVREFGIDRHTLLYLKWITHKVLLYSMLCYSLDERFWGGNGYRYMYD